MKIYIDIFSGEELISDSWDQSAPFGKEELLDVAFEIKSKLVTKSNDDFGISRNIDADEENGESQFNEAPAEKVIDVVETFRLDEVFMDKPEFMQYMRNYMKKVTGYISEHCPERLEIFKAKVSTLVGKMVSQYSASRFFLGPNSSEAYSEYKAHLIVGYYVGEEESPRFIFLKDTLREEKC